MENISLFAGNVFSIGPRNKNSYKGLVRPVETLKQQYNTKNVLIDKNTKMKYTSLAEMKAAVYVKDLKTNTFQVDQNTDEGKFLAQIATLSRGFIEQYLISLTEHVNPAEKKKLISALNSTKNGVADMEEREAVYKHYFPYTTRSKIIGDVANHLFQYYILDVDDNEGND